MRFATPSAVVSAAPVAASASAEASPAGADVAFLSRATSSPSAGASPSRSTSFPLPAPRGFFVSFSSPLGAETLRLRAVPPPPLDSAGGRPRGRPAFCLGSAASASRSAFAFFGFALPSRPAPFADRLPEAAEGVLAFFFGAGFASAALSRFAPFFSADAGGREEGRFRAFSSFRGRPGPRFFGADATGASPLLRGGFLADPVAFLFAFGLTLNAAAAEAAALARFGVFAGASPLAPFAGRPPERFGAGSSSESCGTRASRRRERVRFYFFRASRGGIVDAGGTCSSPRARVGDNDEATREPRDGGRRTESALPREYSPGYMFLHLSCREEREGSVTGQRREAGSA